MDLKKYNFSDYEDILVRQGLLKNSYFFNKQNLVIDFLEYNSKHVKEGTLFVCKGEAFNREYLLEAISNGAVAYIAEKDYELESEIPFILVSDIDKAMAPIADLYYNYPQEKLKIIGVGGTKGKTTTTHYIKEILDYYLNHSKRRPAGILSSIHVFNGKETIDAINTTPVAMDLKKYLAQMVAAGLEYVVMEASSQGFKYHRTAGIEFEVSVFLNIDEDHISPAEHSNYQDYLDSKAMMFSQTKKLIINQETQDADYLFKKVKDAEEYYTISIENPDVDYWAYDKKSFDLGSEFKVKSNSFDETYHLGMYGEFNIENALAAIATIDLLGFSQKYVSTVLKNVEVSGRMMVFKDEQSEIIGVADYAHNRLSFTSLVESIKNTYPNYKIISIFGCPGKKAYGRREEMGTIANEYTDLVYLTAEDPGSEAVNEISKEIANYINDVPYEIIENRQEAIRQAFSNANEKTVILVVGKGEEETMYVNGQYEYMPSDVSIIKECLNL